MFTCEGRGKNSWPNSGYYAARAGREAGGWVDLHVTPRYFQAGPLSFVAHSQFAAFTLHP